MSKCCGGSRICKIISRHVNGLHRGNRSLSCGGNTFLKTTHISCKSWLVTDSRWNTSKKGRHLGTSLGETENVVNEKKHILSFLITEIFSNGQTCKGDSGAGTWGFVHLSVHQGGLGTSSGSGLLVNLDNTTLNHFVVQIISFTGTFSNSSKDRVTSVVHGNVVNKFHDNNSLSDTSSSEKTNLSSLGVGGKKINDLDTSDKNFLRFTLLGESGGRSVKWGELFACLVSEDGSLFIYRFSDDIDNASKSLWSDRNLDRSSSILTLLSTNKTIGTFHSNCSDCVLSQVLGDFQDQTFTSFRYVDLKGVQNFWKLIVELNIDDGSNNLSHLTGIKCCSSAAVSTCP